MSTEIKTEYGADQIQILEGLEAVRKLSLIHIYIIHIFHISIFPPFFSTYLSPLSTFSFPHTHLYTFFLILPLFKKNLSYINIPS